MEQCETMGERLYKLNMKSNLIGEKITRNLAKNTATVVLALSA